MHILGDLSKGPSDPRENHAFVEAVNKDFRKEVGRSYRQKQVIAYMDALDAYREILSDLNQQQFDKILEAFKLQSNVPLKVSEIRVFLIKVGEAYFEKKIKRLLDATEDRKLIEGHAQTHVGRPRINPVS